MSDQLKGVDAAPNVIEAKPADPSPQANASPFTVPEELLAREIGVARALIRIWRRGMERGKHWELIEGQVCLSLAASEEAKIHFLKGTADIDVPPMPKMEISPEI